jgi:hypothetical protein
MKQAKTLRPEDLKLVLANVATVRRFFSVAT